MSSRPSGGGPLDRIMRRMGAITRFTRLGTPAPGRQVQAAPTQGAPQPRPPATGGATQPPAPSTSAPATASAAPGELPPGREIVLPDTAMQAEPITAAPAPQPGQLLGDVQESPAQTYWRRYGMMPNWFSLQVMASRRELEKSLGRPPTANEVAQRLSARDMSTTSEAPNI